MIRSNAVRNPRRRSEFFFSRRRLLLSWFFGLMILGGCDFQRQSAADGVGTNGPGGDPTSVIPEMLRASAASWNGGDLAGFLDDYWNSDELTFSGAQGVTRGWADVRSRYLESYWAPGSDRDSLRFEGIEVLALGDEHALALGRYVLFKPEEGGLATSSGFFSLVFRRMDGKWKILHDHTSATPAEDQPGDGES